MEKKEYEMSDLLCISIIQKEDERMNDPRAWLNKYKGLYIRFNIQPGKLPAIANCNFEGVRYENIAVFHKIYQKLQNELTIVDTWKHADAIAYFFEELNLSMLVECLKQEYYNGMDYTDFIYQLAVAFTEMEFRGNLKTRTISCTCKQCCRQQYFFIGEKDGSYFDLTLFLENEKVIDIYECEEAKCMVPEELNLEKRIWIDPNKTPF
jgi:hypothetical protein